MEMTHYMELLATNQPWNLIIFMAIPVILAEIVAITELFILFGRIQSGIIKTLNKTAGIIGGIYFTGVTIYLINNAVIPLSLTGSWRGPADIIAVGFYLAGVFPLLGIALLELGIIFKNATAEQKLFRHSVFVAIFLVVAHVAMIFGMLNPSLLKASQPTSASEQILNRENINTNLPQQMNMNDHSMMEM